MDCTTPESAGEGGMVIPRPGGSLAISLLTGGGDPHYAYGLSVSLASQGVVIDLIGSDEFELPAFRGNPAIRSLNLRGSVDSKASTRTKIIRILRYYARLIKYSVSAKPKIFHILWNNKFEWFDRTLLLLFYRMLGKRIVLTAHNVNAGRRDGADTWLNRLTLRIQYRLAHCIFTHTEKMKHELIEEFGVSSARVVLIPYGINNAVPNSGITPLEARKRLDILPNERVLLIFGRINPYKGIEYLVSAFQQLCLRKEPYRLIVAGRVEDCENYWRGLLRKMEKDVESARILVNAEFVPDDFIEIYFKAADALVLPYRHIYQSGVLFLGHSFGLPVLASDVGSFREEIVEGKTGFVFQSEDVTDLVRAIDTYFASDLYRNLNVSRTEIREYATELHSWETVGCMTAGVYADLLDGSVPKVTSGRTPAKTPFNGKTPAPGGQCQT
jgi:D-inositol-3-phosphate glycosyltransferase